MEHEADSQNSEQRKTGAFGRVKIVFTVFASLVFFTTVLIASAQIRDSYEALMDSKERESRNLARSGRSHAAQIFSEAQRILEGIANLYVDRLRRSEVGEAFFHDLLRASVTSSGFIDAVYLLDQEGYALASSYTFPLDQRSKSFSVMRPMGISPDRQEFHLLNFERASESSGENIGGRWFVPAVFPIQDGSGQRLGYLIGMIDPTVFQAFYSAMEVGDQGMVLLWDDHGTLIAGNENARWSTGEQVPRIADRMASAKTGKRGGYAITYVSAFDDRPVVTSLLDMREFGLWLSVALDSRDFLAPWRQSRTQIIAEASVFLLFLAALSVIFFRQLNRIEISERSLIAAKNEAEQANNAKVQFLAQVSHEFRTPLNAIIGFSQAIRDRVFGPYPSEKYSEYADDIYNSGQHLLELVNDIIDFSRTEAGEYRVNKTLINTSECLDKIIAMLSGLAQDKNIKIEKGYPDRAVFLHTDERLVKQAVINILSNAIKFSQTGSVARVTYAVQASEGLEIVISDTGPGIGKSILERVGEPFLVESSETNTEGRGSGLGLSIAKTCMELMNGTLDLESDQGKGTTATLIFPKEVLADAPRSTPPAAV